MKVNLSSLNKFIWKQRKNLKIKPTASQDPAKLDSYDTNLNSTDFYIEYFKILNSINHDEESKWKRKRSKKKQEVNLYIDTDENLFDTPWSERKPHPTPKKPTLDNSLNHSKILSAPVSTKNSNKIEIALNSKIANNELISKYSHRREDKMKCLLRLHGAAVVI